MIKVVPFQADHISQLREQDAQTREKHGLEYEHFKQAEGDNAFTLLEDEVPIFCGGLADTGYGRAQIWGLFGRDCGKHMRFIVRQTKAFLDCSVNHRRVEAHAMYDFGPAHQFLRLIGMKLEASFLQDYFDRGQHASLYVRINA